MVTKPTILVIDDEQEMCDLCRDVFVKDGYRAETAGSGETGLQKVRKIRPDLVLVDLKLPGMSGIDILREIKDFDPNIVSVMITAYASIESAVEAVKLGAYDYLPKPFTLDQLLTVTKRGLERRRLILESEALRQEKEKMKELFISMVSHQLRSPLTAVQGYFDLILGGFVHDAAEQKKMIKQAGERIRGLLTLINDWLKMAQVDKDKVEEKFESLNLAFVLSKTVDLMQPLAKEKGISLQFEPSDGLPHVRGDKETLQEVFANLIDNGIKYNKDGGTVTVRTKENSSQLIIKISDTGIGISKEDMPFIFDEFFRVKNESTQQITGTGLGLSIVKRMVEAHSGSIKVTSELGKGSTFTVSLPKLKKDFDKRGRNGSKKENIDN
jgi:two-component system sensor histidine kinase/response regulator